MGPDVMILGFCFCFCFLTVKWSESRSVTSDSLQLHGLYSPWNSSGQNTGVGSHFLHQGLFPTQGSNPDLLHCRQILYQLSYKGSPRILEWVAYPFSRDLPNPGIELGSPALLADSLPTKLSGKPKGYFGLLPNFGNYEWSCHKYPCAGFIYGYKFSNFGGKIPRSTIVGLYT